MALDSVKYHRCVHDFCIDILRGQQNIFVDVTLFDKLIPNRFIFISCLTHLIRFNQLQTSLKFLWFVLILGIL